MRIRDIRLENNHIIFPGDSLHDVAGKFSVSGMTRLPVVSAGKYRGLADIFKFTGNLPDFNLDDCIVDVPPAGYDSEIESLVSPDLPVVPVVDDSGIFAGYADRDTLMRNLGEEGNPGNMIGFYRQMEEEYRAIFEYSYDGIFISDGNGKVVRINKACEDMEGIVSEEVVGKSVEQLLKEGYYSNSVTLEVLKKKIPVTQLQRAKNGRRIMCTGVPVFKDGRIIRVVINSRDISELSHLEKELEKTRRQSEKLRTQVELLEKEIIQGEKLVYKSSRMQEIMKTINHVALFDSTILLTGESGVGKEMMARLVHRRSSRSSAPFIKVDCGSIPPTLFESELFGYEKGAFTGAEKKGKIGLIELADKGTLFIDEVGELPLELQVKLLRFIQDKEIVKVGGKNTIPIDARIIAATNRDLIGMVESGKFRKDLYYRLNVIPVVIPPLRDRKEDVFILINYFLEKFNKKFNTEKEMDLECLEVLENYTWPGNVRELENMVERLIVLSSEKRITAADLPRSVREYRYSEKVFSPINPGDTYRSAMLKVERKLLSDAMNRASTVKEMADILGLDKSSVSRKLKKHGITLR